MIIHKIQARSREEFSHKVAPTFAERHKAVAFDVLEGPDLQAEATEAVSLVPDIPLVVKLHTPCCIFRQTADRSSLRKKLRGQLGALKQWIDPNSIENREKKHALVADVIAAPSEAIGERLQKHWNLDSQKIHYFPCPFVPSSELLEIPIEKKDDKTVTFVGNLSLRKGAVHLAQAVPRILNQFPDAKFCFVGGGGSARSPHPHQNMKQCIMSYFQPYHQAVELTGNVPNDRIPSILSQSNVCVFPSLFDSFGFVCLEAMAAGRAVVGSNSGGMAEIINSAAVGRLVPPRNPEQIAQKVIELLSNVELRVQMGVKARERVLEVYNAERIGKLQEKSYLRAIENKFRSSRRLTDKSLSIRDR